MAEQETIRLKDADRSALLSIIVTQRLTIRRLEAIKEPVHCAQCRYRRASREGMFLRCARQGLRVVAWDDFCSDGRPRG